MARIHKALVARGLHLWFDEERMIGDIETTMLAGVDASAVFIPFITTVYSQKLLATDDYCAIVSDFVGNGGSLLTE